MNQTVLLSLFSGGGAFVFTGLWWIISRIMSYQGQFKHIDERFKHLEEKIDSAVRHIDDKIDIILQSNANLMNAHSERIARLEKYFDAIMQNQIDKNSDKFEMSTGKK